MVTENLLKCPDGGYEISAKMFPPWWSLLNFPLCLFTECGGRNKQEQSDIPGWSGRGWWSYLSLEQTKTAESAGISSHIVRSEHNQIDETCMNTKGSDKPALLFEAGDVIFPWDRQKLQSQQISQYTCSPMFIVLSPIGERQMLRWACNRPVLPEPLLFAYTILEADEVIFP